MMMTEEVLIHHGIKGQRWGIRRFQNEDGTLTEAGRKRLGSVKDRTMKSIEFRQKLTKNAIDSNKESIQDLKEYGIHSKTAQEHWESLDSDAKKELLRRSDYGETGDIFLDLIFPNAPAAKASAMKQMVKEDISSLTKENRELVSAGKQYTERYNSLSALDVNALGNQNGYKEAKKQIKAMKKLT